MLPLDKDLQQKKSSITEFGLLANRILAYLPNILSGHEDRNNYRLYYSTIAGTKKFIRPINQSLFIMDPGAFSVELERLQAIIIKIRDKNKSYSKIETQTIDSVLYTMQQSIGAGFDLLGDPNGARKHVGNRFEELIKALFTEIGVPNKRVVFRIPYDSGNGEKNYTCENDLILSPDKKEIQARPPGELLSETTEGDNNIGETLGLTLSPETEIIANKYITDNEVIVSVKTTSKDRMGKMFMDKILLERFVGHDLKVIGIFLKDVQRKGERDISFTLVSDLFMVYNKFITQLNGIYYLDPPPNALKEPFNKYMKPFSKLITEDIEALLSA
jgi:hypothetical protein